MDWLKLSSMKRDRELELEAELELSLLQINQLQEELEHYYLECSRLKEQEAEYYSAPSQIPAQVLLTESRVNDSRYSESGFYEKSKSLLSQVSQLKQALESSTKEKAMEAHGHQENKKRAEQLTVDLKESSRSVALGQKMLAKSQVDLDHLRDSYAEKVASERELVELVNELREKLTLASQYYLDLQKEHPEILLPIENTQSS